MAKQGINNVKLGAFVLAGLLFLVLLLYMIGKNRNLFGATYLLKAKFENVQGLVTGNNVRFAGIEAGTVKKIKILNDTTIEITMTIDKKMANVIRKNAIVSIGTEGFVGNKVVNIVPSRQPAALAEDGDILVSKKSIDADAMLQTLSKTNTDAAVIAASLKITIERINKSSALWDLLNDKSLPRDLKTSVSNLRAATAKASNMVSGIDEIVRDVKNGKGSLGAILTDTSFASHLNEAILKIMHVGDEADSLADMLTKMSGDIQNDINNGKGTINALLKDSMMVIKLNESLNNIQQGTDAFNQNMEALKHNFMLRGYFKKQEKQRMKEQSQAEVNNN